MRPIVEGCTSFQAWFAVTDAIGREQLRRLGGERFEPRYSATFKHGTQSDPSVTVREEVVPRIDGTTVSDVTADRNRFFARLCDNDGYATYKDLIFTANFMFHQPKATYDKDADIKQTPWPTGTPGTVINGSGPVTTVGQAPSPTAVQTISPTGKRRRTNRLGGNPGAQSTP